MPMWGESAGEPEARPPAIPEPPPTRRTAPPAGAPARRGPVGRENLEDRDAPDPVGVAAVITGCIGIVVLGIVLAIVTAILASSAGQRARAGGRSLSTAYLAFGLAALDGVVWLVLQLLFKQLPAVAG
jgi:hypothetical protein